MGRYGGGGGRWSLGNCGIAARAFYGATAALMKKERGGGMRK